MPKKILLASICLVVLFGAVGVYSYVTISSLNNQISDLESQIDSLQEDVSNLEEERDSLQNNVSSLESQIDALQEEIAHLQNELSHLNSMRTFVFEWSPYVQNITNGTLRMELTFTWKEGEENLSIVARINDDEYNPIDWLGSGLPDFLAIVLDKENDGQLEGEPALVASVDNYTIAAEFSGGRLEWVWWMPEPSEFHTCVFEPSVGYTFNVTLPLTYYDTFGEKQYIYSDLVYVGYNDAVAGYVEVCFHFRGS